MPDKRWEKRIEKAKKHADLLQQKQREAEVRDQTIQKNCKKPPLPLPAK